MREMQDPENGVPVRSQKLFLTSIPSAFMGEHALVYLVFGATERRVINKSPIGEILRAEKNVFCHSYYI